MDEVARKEKDAEESRGHVEVAPDHFNTSFSLDDGKGADIPSESQQTGADP